MGFLGVFAVGAEYLRLEMEVAGIFKIEFEDFGFGFAFGFGLGFGEFREEICEFGVFLARPGVFGLFVLVVEVVVVLVGVMVEIDDSSSFRADSSSFDDVSSSKNWATTKSRSSPKNCIFFSAIPSIARNCSWLVGFSSAIFLNVCSVKSLFSKNKHQLSLLLPLHPSIRISSSFL